MIAAIAVALMTAILALNATPSAAQKGRKHRGDGSARVPAKKADDKAYKAAIESLPDGKLDPWRNMR
jgi:hypothetical protein